jgi:DMSO reductase anchor subunit
VAAFGAFAALSSTAAAAVLFRPEFAKWLSAGAAASGAAAVACSVMVYHVVRRPFWHASTTGPKFAGTAAVLGLAATLVATGGARPVALGLAAAAVIKIALEAAVLTHLRDLRPTPLRRTAERLLGALKGPAAVRLGLGLLGGVVLPLAASAAPPGARTGLAAAAFVAAFGGELAERYLFFSAVVRPKMPGGVAS